MAWTPTGHFSFLVPARAASSEGVRVFDVGAIPPPLSPDQERALGAVLERIIQRYKPQLDAEAAAAAASADATAGP